MPWIDVEANAPKQRQMGNTTTDFGLPKSTDEWVDAGKGAAVAYNQKPVTENVPAVLKNTANVSEGLIDSTLGVGAGINETFADIINFFDGDGNAVADWLRQGADDLRSKQFKQDGVMSAVGEKAGELAAGSAAGGAVGKLFGNAVKAADKVIPKPFREKSVRALFGDESAQASKGIRGIEKISDDIMTGRRYDKNPSILNYKTPKNISEEIVKRASNNAPNVGSSPLFSLAKAEKLWQRLIGSNTPYSKDLAAQTKKLVDAGYSYDEALKLVKKAWDTRAAKYVPKDAVGGSAKVGSAVGALFGMGE